MYQNWIRIKGAWVWKDVALCSEYRSSIMKMNWANPREYCRYIVCTNIGKVMMIAKGRCIICGMYPYKNMSGMGDETQDIFDFLSFLDHIWWIPLLFWSHHIWKSQHSYHPIFLLSTDMRFFFFKWWGEPPDIDSEAKSFLNHHPESSLQLTQTHLPRS